MKASPAQFWRRRLNAAVHVLLAFGLLLPPPSAIVGIGAGIGAAAVILTPATSQAARKPRLIGRAAKVLWRVTPLWLIPRPVKRWLGKLAIKAIKRALMRSNKARLEGLLQQRLVALAARNPGGAAKIAEKLGIRFNAVARGKPTSKFNEAVSKITTRFPQFGKKFNQIGRRGWTEDSINSLVNRPFTTRPTTNKATGNSATAYFRQDGHYVVRDDITGEIVQMSDTKRTIGNALGQWKTDPEIANPYVP